MARLLVQLAYRWQPSRDYERRQAQIRDTNRWLKYRRGEARTVPPILSYTEDTDVAPTRLQPMPNQDRHEGQLLPVEDLSDLEQAAILQDARVIHPRLSGPDAELMLAYRPLLPRQYRRFLRYSPYPRILMSLLTAAAVLCSVLWVNQVHQAEALAAGRFHVARHAFQATIEGAQIYGVDPRNLRLLEVRARALDSRAPPSGLPVSRARARFYQEQGRAYTSLLRRLRRIERRALQYWQWREGVARAALVTATREVNKLGLGAALSAAPACRTPTCYRMAVPVQGARTAWLRETARTLRVYGMVVAASQDPVSAAGAQLQKARALHALLPSAAPLPAVMAGLDGMYATAARPGDYARVGALAHLDVDALLAHLVRALPSRAIVVSTEDQSLTCYERGKAVYHSLITADSRTPNGIFHIQGKQAEVATLYWGPYGQLLRYRDGSLPDWMPFTRDAAFQAAPWRSAFGPGSDGSPPLYAPYTPGSIDLPPAAGERLFGWASVGTEVVIY